MSDAVPLRPLSGSTLSPAAELAFDLVVDPALTGASAVPGAASTNAPLDVVAAATGIVAGIPIGEFIDSITLLPGPTTQSSDDGVF